MKRIVAVIFGSLLIFFTSEITMGQGIGEYGRVLGGATQGSRGVSPKTSGIGVPKSKGIVQGVGGLDHGSPLPTQLVVSAKVASLYPRQDDETDQIQSLPHGERLVPMMQSTGAGAGWYLVKTKKGNIGWIKSTDVKGHEAKKP